MSFIWNTCESTSGDKYLFLALRYFMQWRRIPNCQQNPYVLITDFNCCCNQVTLLSSNAGYEAAWCLAP